ncbi:DHS-like NAD/FAD-binding domain-containing protein [Pyronema omphalodes]|nr:DHS-like NAD/FAD-binding domain-containing protein [Pyronema omphalodes]
MSKDAPPAATAPAAPKRQRSPPKPRETQFLDLPFRESTGQRAALDSLQKLLRKKKKIVVIAGAGISVNAGIPDFRGSDGLFATLKTSKNSGKDLFDASVYKDNFLTASFHDMVRDLHGLASRAQPTQFHHLLATLATEGRLLRLYSQNVDCIETRLEPLNTVVPLQTKGPWPRTIQVHGGLEKMNCQKCGWVGPLEPDLFIGAEPPDCPECKEMESIRGIAGKRSLGIGKLRPRIVLYNEFHPDADAIGAVSSADIKARPDAVIVVGTSLKVPGVKRIVSEMCKTVRDFRGGLCVWVNKNDPPPAKDYAFDLVVRGDCEELAVLMKAQPEEGSDQDMSSVESFTEVDAEEPCKDSSMLEVVIPTQLPSPALSTASSTLFGDSTTQAKSRKRAPAPTKVEKPPPKPRGRKPASEKPPAKKKAAASKPPTTGLISNAFKATKAPTAAAKAKAKAAAAEKAAPAKMEPLVIIPDTMFMGSSLSPVPSSIPSPVTSTRSSIPVSSLLN